MDNKQKKTCLIPLAFYVHIPFCTAKCSYCGFYSEAVTNYDTELLVKALIREMSQYDTSGIKTIYIGGGSPTCLPFDQLEILITEITAHCPDFMEFTIEANPGQVNEALLKKLRIIGINRLSIGAQSFNQTELDFLGRSHKVEDITNTIKYGLNSGFDNISVDLIFAVPGSSLESWTHSLQSAIDLDIEHVSAYCLTYEQSTPLKTAVEEQRIIPVDEETDRCMYYIAIDKLAEAGYLQYEISNFARPGFECKHNLNYWQNRPFIGIGPAAASYYHGKRTINVANINEYIQNIQKGKSAVVESETPSEIEIACQTAVLNLRTINGIDSAEFRKQTGFDVLNLFNEPIKENQQLGLLNVSEDKISLTKEALAIADSVICDFAAV